MRIAGSVLALICGIVVLVGVFMPWIDVRSGWDIISQEGVFDGAQPFMVLLAGIAVIGFALPSFIVSMVTRGGKAAVVTLSALASVASIVALGGAIWFIINILTSPGPLNIKFNLIGYGVYISAAAALVGMIFAFVTMSAAIAAKPRPRVARYAAAPAPAPAPVTAPPPAPVVTMHAAPVVAPPPPPPAPVAATPPPPPPPLPPPPPPPPPPAPKRAAKKVKAEPAFAPAEAAPVVEEAKAPAPEKPKKPAVKKTEEAPAAKPEGIDESTLPMVQQPWETPEEFRARRKRKTVQF